MRLFDELLKAAIAAFFTLILAVIIYTAEK